MPRARPSGGDTPQDSRFELEELAAFGAALEELRRQSRLSYRSLSSKAGCSSSALAKAASGRERPTLEVVRAFVTACEGDLADWIDRWRTMSAAVDRYQRDLQGMVDAPYEIMTCPSSPARFNRQLQLRVCRAGKQAGVALRANYAPSTASGIFNGTRLASEEFVRRMLVAATAPDKEQAVWLEWHNRLAREPRRTARPATTVTPAQHSQSRRCAIPLIFMSVAACAGAMGLAAAPLTPSPDSNVGPNAEFRSQPKDVHLPRPAPEASSGVNHGLKPPVGVPTAEGASSSETGRMTAVPILPPASSPVTPDDVHRWPATIVGNQALIDVGQLGQGVASMINPGDTTFIICFTTKTQPTGWYYTDQGDYLNPAIVQFSGDDKNAVPPCNKVSFPEGRMTPMPNDSSYSRNTEKR